MFVNKVTQAIYLKSGLFILTQNQDVVFFKRVSLSKTINVIIKTFDYLKLWNCRYGGFRDTEY